MQERTRRPPTWTVHAPHSPRSQAFFVPVKPSSSRNASSSVVRGSTIIARTWPLTVMLTWATKGPGASPPAVTLAVLPRSRLIIGHLAAFWLRISCRGSDGRADHAALSHRATVAVPIGYKVPAHPLRDELPGAGDSALGAMSSPCKVN